MFFGYTGAVMGVPPSGVYVPGVLVVVSQVAQYRFPQVLGYAEHLDTMMPGRPAVLMHAVPNRLLSGQYVRLEEYTGAVMGVPPSGVYVPGVLVVSQPVVLVVLVPPVLVEPPTLAPPPEAVGVPPVLALPPVGGLPPLGLEPPVAAVPPAFFVPPVLAPPDEAAPPAAVTPPVLSGIVVPDVPAVEGAPPVFDAPPIAEVVAPPEVTPPDAALPELPPAPPIAVAPAFAPELPPADTRPPVLLPPRPEPPDADEPAVFDVPPLLPPTPASLMTLTTVVAEYEEQPATTAVRIANAYLRDVFRGSKSSCLSMRLPSPMFGYKCWDWAGNPPKSPFQAHGE